MARDLRRHKIQMRRLAALSGRATERPVIAGQSFNVNDEQTAMQNFRNFGGDDFGGELNYEQMRKLMRKQGRHMDNRQFEAFIKHVDADGDGSVTMDEFAAALQKVKVPPKSEETITLLATTLKKHFWFRALSTDTLTAAARALRKSVVARGQVIFRQGEEGDLFYVLERGEVTVQVDDSVIGTISAPAAFGELGLMFNAQQPATVRTMTTCQLWVTNRLTFRKTLALCAARKALGRCEFLKQVPILSSLNNMQVSLLADAFTDIRYSKGDNIIVQGEPGTKFFIILEGQVAVKRRETPSSPYKELVVLKPGAFFGEQALLTTENRNATCTAKTTVMCQYLDKKQFDQLLGKLSALIEATAQNRSNPMEKPAFKKAAAIFRNAKNRVPQLQLSDFEVMRTIRKGFMGRLRLVQYKEKRKGRPLVMALKVFRKQKLVEKQWVARALGEKRALASMRSPYVAKLFGTAQDAGHLYLFMEMMHGGSLWSLLYTSETVQRSRLGGLKTNLARWYAAQVVLALKHIHSKSFMHRDLRLENVIVDVGGYVKLVGFGFSKFLEVGKQTQTLCGTPEYLAPEQVLSRGHSHSVDLWALGVLIYEMLRGRTPFVDEDPSKVFMKIVHSQFCLEFDNGFPKAPCLFCKRLLNPKPTLRIGSLARGFLDLTENRWFQKIEWRMLQHRQYRAVHMPLVEDEFDDSNFPHIDESEEQGPPPVFALPEGGADPFAMW